MAQPFSSREDFKRDILQEYTKTALDWIAVHRQAFFSGVGTVAVVAVIAIFMVANFKNLRKQAWEKYSMGQNWYFANNPENALTHFNQVIKEYGRTPAATLALMSKGDLFYNQKKYAESIEAFKQCIERRPEKPVLAFALVGLGAAQEDSGDYASAITTYRQFTNEYPDHFLVPKVYESLARSYELSHNPDAAKEVYEKIITVFPGTPWSEKARIRYQSISPQPFQGDAGAQTAPSLPDTPKK